MEMEDRDGEIAVVGMSCRFPGARDPAEFWRNLRDGVESIAFFSPAELRAAGVPDALAGDPSFVAAHGALADAYAFDAPFFGIAAREAQAMDPQHRVFLECAWSALEDAGVDPAAFPGAIGVYAGSGHSPHLERVMADPELAALVPHELAVHGNDKDFLTTRVSYRLGLRGPSVVVQTACSTSLVAIHVACQSLLSHECDLALAGGVTICVDEVCGYLHQEGGIHSPDGHCRAFDARAAGTVAGSGAGVVALKRMNDALRDGDVVHAVVKGSAINNDGAAKIGFTAPSVSGQARAIVEALGLAGVEPAEVSYVETHGTGTPLGDPIEIAALREVFGPAPGGEPFCALGAVKTSFGHLDTAAGVAGFIKTVLALKHETIPPTLHFERPNPETGLEGSPFFVNAAARPWPRGEVPRRAGVSSFGIGGTNAHVVLEEAPAPSPAPAGDGAARLLVLSAKSEAALARMRANLAAHLDAHPDLPLADVAFTLQTGRAAHPHRWAAAARDAEGARAALAGGGTARRAAERTPPVAFLFPGQGTQYAGMARGLYEREPAFRAEVDRSLAALEPALAAELRGALFPAAGGDEAANALLRETRLTQPALFVVEYALARLWQGWGVRPAAMLGHSIGEYVAAALAGVFSPGAALRLVAARGRLMQSLPAGAMLAVPLPEAEVRPLLSARLSLAAVNGASSCVVSGETDEVEAVEALLAGRDVAAKRVRTSHAFHSAAMDPILDAFAAEVAAACPAAPSIPFLSNVTGDWITAEEATDPGYWVRHLRETVRFADGVGRLLEDGDRVLLEVGPGETLGAFARRHGGARRVIVSTLPGAGKPGDAEAAALDAAGALWTAGVALDWAALRGGAPGRRVSLPTYPFERTIHQVRAPAPAASAAPDPSVAGSAAAAGSQTRIAGPLLLFPTQTTVATETIESPARAPRIAAHVTELFARLLGADPAELDPTASFLELGTDSLLLMQASRMVESTFGMRIPFRRLLDGLDTVAALSAHLDAHLPADFVLPGDPPPAPPAEAPSVAAPVVAAPAVVPVAAAPVAAPAVIALAPQPAASAADGGLRELFAQQIALLNRQLDLLGGAAAPGSSPVIHPAHPTANGVEVTNGHAANGHGGNGHSTNGHAANGHGGNGHGTNGHGTNGHHARATTPPAMESRIERVRAAADAADAPAPAPASHGPHRPVRATVGQGGARNERQARHFEELVERYTARTRRSKAYAAHNRPFLADNRAALGFRQASKELMYPIVGERSEGTRLWDVDGNEYVDFTIGFGVHFFGHRPPFIVRAVEEQLRRGFHTGPQSDLAGPTAELFRELTGMERVTFCNTGSEAVMTAVRVARTATGRDRVVMFEGSYHGCFDGILARSGGGAGTLPIAPGTPQGMVDDVVVLPYGAPGSLDYIRAHAGELAAVLVEPVQSSDPELQPREFLHEVRALTERSGTVLIFDEMITGLRMGHRGAQGFFGVEADLATYGKVIGGGLPAGVLAGRARLMDAVDGGMWSFGDDSFPAADQTFFAGTFCKHPAVMAAAHAVLVHLKEQGQALYDALHARADRLVAALRQVLEEEGAPIQIVHAHSYFRFVFRPEDQFIDLLFYHMLERGIYVWEGRGCFLSTAHTDEDCDAMVRALRESIHALREGGFLPDRPGPGGGPDGAADPSAPRPPAATLGDGPTSFPLTPAQRQVWVHAQLGDDASRAYNEQIVIGVRGRLDAEALRTALEDLAAHHESLRTVFDPSGEAQHVLPSIPLSFTVDEVAAPGGLEAAMAEEARGVFDLARGPLFRARLHDDGEGGQVLQVVVHHLAADGVATDLLERDLEAAYLARVQGHAPRLPGAMQFRAYAAHLAAHAETYAEGEAAWLERFRGAAPPALPYDRPRPAAPTHRAGSAWLALPAATAAAVRERGARLGCTPFMTLAAALLATLHRTTGQDDLVVGIPSAGRPFEGAEGVVGHCVDVLPVRSRLAAGRGAAEFLRDVRGWLLDAYEHEVFSAARLHEGLRAAHRPSLPPRVSVTFNLEPGGREMGAPRTFAGLEVVERGEAAGFTKFDLSFDAVDTGGEIHVACLYNADLFEHATVERLLAQLRRMVEGLAAHPDARVAELDLLGAEERARVLVEWNRTEAAFPADRCIHHLFEAQAARTPDAVAVTFGDASLTCAELDARANRLAHHLRGRGVGAEVRVGVLMERSLEMVVALLAVLKAGGAYVPLEPGYPAERLAWMVADAGVPLVLTHAPAAAALPAGTAAEVLAVDDAAAAARIAAEPAHAPAGGATPDSLAYVIYTSGSTGRPKGVMNAHRGVVNRLVWMQAQFGIGADDVVLQKTPFGFDVSVWEFFWPLQQGARLVVARPDGHRDPAYLREVIEHEGVTIVHFVPSMLQPFVEAVEAGRCASLRHVVCSGEALPPTLVARFYDRFAGPVVLTNLYGPTEAAVDVSAWTCARGELLDTVPIGRPVWNTALYVLDAALQPVPVGAAGELYIGGVQVARGYLGRAALTAERFVPDPFSVQGGARLYRTGDRARWRADGAIEYLGRLDFQVKVRGFRIELGEIESVLLGHPGVREAVVQAREDAPGDPRLVAYVVPDRTHAGGVLELQRLEREAAEAGPRPYELPNGMGIAHLNAAETRFLYREIFEDRSYLRHGVALGEGACVFDVGANIGLFTLFAGTLRPDVTVYAFEPIPPVFEALETNARIHGLDVRLFNCGVGSAPGEETFTFYPHASVLSGRQVDEDEARAVVRSFIHNEQDSGAGAMDEALLEEMLEARLETERVTSEIRTLSQVIREQGVERIDLLKVDVEGGEYDVLAGIEEEHWERISQVVAEAHEHDRERVTELLARHGFAVAVEQEHGLEGTGLHTVYAVRPEAAAAAEPAAEAAPARGWSTPSALTRDLRELGRERLPEHMVPAAYVYLEALPLTPNGKVDRKALPAPELASAEDRYVAPRTPTEEVLAGIWAEVLRLERVGARDGFFDLGGHSLLATRVVSRVRAALGVELPVSALFEAPTVAALAARIEESRADALPAAPPVARVEGDEPPPLSFAQERLWFLDRLRPGSAFYNHVRALRIDGALDVAALERALGEIVRRHEPLRTTFREVGDAPVQVVAPFAPLVLPVEDLAALPEAEREESAARRVAEEAAHPFDLAAGPLFRPRLLRLADEAHVLILGMHHVVTDGWSNALFDGELAALYGAFAAGRASPLADLPVRYADYAAWQRERLRGDVLERHLAWWRERLAGAPALLELPTDHPRPPVRTPRGAYERASFPTALLDRLRALGRSEGATLYMVLLGAFQVLLAKYAGSADVVVGSPVAGRTRAEVEGLVGFFVNNLVLRTDLSGDPAFGEVLRRVRRVTLGAYEHQELPFERLVEALHPERSLAHSPLFQVMFSVDEAGEGAGPALPGVAVRELEVGSDTVRYDLVLRMTADADGFGALAAYSTELFERATIRRMLGHLARILEQVAADPALPLSALEPMGDEERRAVQAWSWGEAAEPAGPIHRQVEARAAATPGAVAVVHEGERLTYARVNGSANRLARELRARGVGRGVFVPLLLERGAAVPVAMLAAMKAGAAFVPLDPRWPHERLRAALDDLRAPLLLAAGETAEAGRALGLPVLAVDTGGDAAADLEGEAAPGDPLYAIYTSGSTGRPKAAVVHHGGISNRLHWMGERFGAASAACVLQTTRHVYDSAVWQLFWPMIHGGTAVVARDGGEADAAYLVERIEAEGVTTTYFVPSVFNTLVPELAADAGARARLASLRTVGVGGEQITPETAYRFMECFPGVRVVNLYGPTECSIGSVCHVVRGDEGARIPIGTPISSTGALILDAGGRLVPVGVPGEIHLGGRCVGLGYLNDPRKTAAAFVPDSFSGTPGARLYRTGDLARRRADGTIEYLGRRDHQVKVRGFRIEPGEVEARLAEHPGVREAVVMARADAAGDTRLVAWYVGDEADPQALRAHLSTRLPEFMVPAAFVRLDAFPLTPNGKLDRRALPAPDAEAGGARGREAPVGETETALAAIWADVLGVDRVGRWDHFFERGGHSLRAVQVVSRVRRALGAEVALGDLFLHPVLADFARSVAGAARSELPPIVPVPRDGRLELSFAQRRLWFVERMGSAGGAYNLPVWLRLTGRLDRAALEAALGRIVARHETLRTTFALDGDEPVQRIAPAGEGPFVLAAHDLAGHPDARAGLARLIGEEAVAPFDLERGPVIRGRLVRLAGDDHVLLVNVHHIATDGWSTGVLLNELAAHYRAAVEGGPDPLPPLPVQYADYAAWQRRHVEGEVLRRQAAYWKEALAGAPELLELPLDRPRPAQQDLAGAVAPVELDERLTAGLEALARRHGTTLFATVLAAWAAVLGRLSGQREVVVGTPAANRGRGEIEGLIGFFVNTLALRVDLGGAPTVAALLARVRDRALEAQQHADLPFEQVVEIVQPSRSLAHSPLFQAVLAWQNTPAPALELPGLTVRELDADGLEPWVPAKYDLSLGLRESGGRIEGGVWYATALFDRPTIDRWIGYLRNALEAMAADDAARVDTLPLLPEDERRRVIEEWNRTDRPYPRDVCLHALFQRHVAAAPDAPALEWGDLRLTYAELDARANRLAHHLAGRGVGPETRVGVLLERGPELIVSILATLKAGGCYVPLDPAYPPERLRWMLGDAAARVLVTRGGLDAPVAGGEVETVDLDAAAQAIAAEADDAPGSGATPENLAYIVYTSGSTGRPKGVMVNHRTVVQLVVETDYVRLAAGDRIAQASNASFDALAFEAWGAFLNGATLVGIPRDVLLSPAAMAAFLREGRITTLYQTTALLNQLSREAPGIFAPLREVLFGGQQADADAVRRVLRDGAPARLLHVYGPTETTAWCSYETVTHLADDATTVSVGRPTGNQRIYLLDAALHSVPLGAAGEAYVGGGGVVRGYLDRPALTAERFLPDPFAPGPGARMYRTGDRLRHAAGGALEFVGRIDEQVKIRGFRIEPGEVESLLCTHPWVDEARVVTREDVPGEPRLVAYVVGEVNVHELRDFLAAALPEYMLPAAFVVLERIPLTPSGKLDRAALPAPGYAGAIDRHVPPSTPVETVLASIWAEVLRVERVGVNDGFFALGGHSLLLMRLVAEVAAAFGVELSIRAAFAAPTLGAMAAEIERAVYADIVQMTDAQAERLSALHQPAGD